MRISSLPFQQDSNGHFMNETRANPHAKETTEDSIEMKNRLGKFKSTIMTSNSRLDSRRENKLKMFHFKQNKKTLRIKVKKKKGYQHKRDSSQTSLK